MTRLWLFFTYIIFAMLLNSVGTVILQVQNSFQVLPSEAAVLEAYKDLSIAIASFLVASFMVRIGYRRAIIVAQLVMALTCLLLPQLPHFWATKLLFMVTGICFALVKVAVFATLGLLAENRKSHVSLMNYLEAFFMLGVMAGYFIFSAFVSHENPADLQWLQVYYLLALLCTLAFCMSFFVRLDEAAIEAAPEPFAQSFLGMIRLCYQPLVAVFVVSVFLYVLLEQAIMSWLPSFNSQVLKLTPALGIQMASILAASTAVGRLLAGLVTARFDWYRVLMLSLLAAGGLILLALPLANQVGNVVVSRWSDAPLAAYLFPLIGLCLAPVYPAVNAVVLSALPLHQHAPMSGLIVVFSALGGTLGSLITGRLFEWVGGATAFYAALIPLLAILAALTLLRRFVERDSSAGAHTPLQGAEQ